MYIDVEEKGWATKVLESDQMELVTVQLMQLCPLSSHQQLPIFCVICEKYGSKKVFLENLGVVTKFESLKGSDDACISKNAPPSKTGLKQV